jgi:DNA-directed RNA polymerase specialized sigma24 family protein
MKQEVLAVLAEKYLDRQEDEMRRLALRIVQVLLLSSARTYARRNRRFREYAQLAFRLEENVLTAEDAASLHELRDALNDALVAVLSPVQQALVLNCIIKGKPIRLAAKELRISKSKAHRDLDEGLERLQETLSEYAETAQILLNR